MVHELKITPGYFKEVLTGKKTFEVRKNDRPFHYGDLLALNEYDPAINAYSGKSCVVYVDYILDDPAFCKDGYVVMSIKPCVIHRVGAPRNEIKLAEDYGVPLATKEW